MEKEGLSRLLLLVAPWLRGGCQHTTTPPKLVGKALGMMNSVTLRTLPFIPFLNNLIKS